MYYLSSKSHVGSLAVQGKVKKLQKYPWILLETILTAAGKLGHALKLLPSQKLPRKLLAGALSLSMLFSLLPLTTFAAEQQPTLPADSMLEEQQGDVLPEVLAAGDVKTWDISMEKDGTVTATLSSDGTTLAIEGTGPMKNWERGKAPWYGNKGSITTVTIQEGITTIGNSAFYYCAGITSAAIPESVTSIGKDVFYGCSKLSSVAISENVTAIGENAFRSCGLLGSVTMTFTVEKGIKTIGPEAFNSIKTGATIQVVAEADDITPFQGWKSARGDGGTAATFTDKTAAITTLTGTVPNNCNITADYGREAEYTPAGSSTPTLGTFAAALEAMKEQGGSIKLISKVSTDTEVTLPAKAITLDLDGKTWANTGIIVPAGGTVTIPATTGTITGDSTKGYTIKVQEGGELDLQGGEIGSRSDADYCISNEGTVKLSGTVKVAGYVYAVKNDKTGKLYLSGSPELIGYYDDDPTIWCKGSSFVIANNGKVGEELVYCEKPISIQIYEDWVGPVIVSGLRDKAHAESFTFSYNSGESDEVAFVYDDTDKTFKLVESYGIYVGKTPVSETNKDDVLDDGGSVKYDDETSTLTLKDVTIDAENQYTEDSASYGITSFNEDLPLNLVLIGENKIDLEAVESTGGIYTEDSLTISGGGSLKITTAAGSESSYGVHSYREVTLDSVSIDIAIGDTTSSAYGIVGRDISVNAGTLNITTGEAVLSYGIKGNMGSILANGRIDIKTEDGAVNTVGIDADGGIKVEGGTLKIVTGQSETSFGMYASKSVLITDGIVDITAGEATVEEYGASVGIRCDNEGGIDTPIQITGGTVTVATKGGVGEPLQAIAPAPDFSEYNRGVAVGSANGDGSSTVTYSADDNDTYKYVKIYKKPNRPVVTPTPAPTATPTPTVTPTPGPTEAPSKGETTVTTPVDQDGNASVLVSDQNVTDAIEQAKENATPGQPIAVSIVVETDQVASKITATLPKTVQETLIGNKVNSITIVSDTVTMGFTQEAIQLMNNQAKADIDIIATKASTEELTGEAAELIRDRPLYDFTAVYNRIYKITDFGGNTVSLSIPYALREGENPEDVEAVYVDEAGEATSVEDSVYNQEKQSVDFTVSHFSGYGVGYRQSVPMFKDIENHWAKADIEFVAKEGLLLGMGDQMFSPNTPMTRGMFVTALGRMAGIDPADFTSGKFTDVKEGAYYAPYVHWAAEKSIVNGTSATTFSPNQGISRQEMAVIMINYATAFDYTIPETLDPVTFADQDDIGTWAAEAVRQMQMAGVMNGRNDLTFDPIGTATRAEVATVLHRYIQLVIESNP